MDNQKKHYQYLLNWHALYNYPKDIAEDLKQNRLSSRSRAKFIAAICSAIFSHKSFPTTHKYNHVGEQIINNHHFFKKQIWICNYTPYMWIRTYVFSSGNNACSDKKHQEHKAKSQKDSNRLLQCIPKQKMVFLPKYPVPLKISLSEDDAFYGRHMKIETQKPSLNKQMIRSLMNVTYPFWGIRKRNGNSWNTENISTS